MTKDKNWGELSGWLFLFIILFVVGIVSDCFSLIRLSDAADSRNILIIAVQAIGVISIPLGVTSIVLFFRKNIKFRTLFVIRFGLAFVSNACSMGYLIGHDIAYDFGSIVRWLVINTIWIIYLYNSKSVAYTFGLKPLPGLEESAPVEAPLASQAEESKPGMK